MDAPHSPESEQPSHDEAPAATLEAEAASRDFSPAQSFHESEVNVAKADASHAAKEEEVQIMNPSQELALTVAQQAALLLLSHLDASLAPELCPGQELYPLPCKTLSSKPITPMKHFLSSRGIVSPVTALSSNWNATEAN